jgi:hypothetical protein
LIVDYDTAGRTVLLAIRDIGTECPVEALSERARDQLCLALRVAAVEAQHAPATHSLVLPSLAELRPASTHSSRRFKSREGNHRQLTRIMVAC